MGKCEASGPDGFPAGFFQHYWDIVGPVVTKAVLQFCHTGLVSEGLNHTNIVRIPKSPCPTKVSDFRPISLCNVLYKIVTKMLVNRLRHKITKLVAPYQNAFVPGRLISDNVLIAHEVLQFIRKRKQGNTYLAALKLDISKAYDRVSWQFLVAMLHKMGFPDSWIRIISQCISSVSASIIVNGVPSPIIYPLDVSVKVVHYLLIYSLYANKLCPLS